MDHSDQKNDQEIKELLEEDIELNKENNDMLKSMSRSARWSLIFSVIKWMVILGSAFGVYYYFGQFFESMIIKYNELLGTSTPQNSSITSSLLEQVREIMKKI
jgi:hypothetical protein